MGAKSEFKFEVDYVSTDGKHKETIGYRVCFLYHNDVTVCVLLTDKNVSYRRAGVAVLHPGEPYFAAVGRHKAMRAMLGGNWVNDHLAKVIKTAYWDAFKDEIDEKLYKKWYKKNKTKGK